MQGKLESNTSAEGTLDEMWLEWQELVGGAAEGMC